MVHKFEFLKLNVVLVYLCYVNVNKIELRNKRVNSPESITATCQEVIFFTLAYFITFPLNLLTKARCFFSLPIS